MKKNSVKTGTSRWQRGTVPEASRRPASVCVCGFNWEDHWDDGHRKSTNPVSPDFNWTLPPPSSSLDVFDFYSFFLWIMHRRLRRDRLLPSFFCFCFFVVFFCFAFYWSGFTEFYFQFVVVFFGFHYRVSLEDDVPIERFRRKKKRKRVRNVRLLFCARGAKIRSNQRRRREILASSLRRRRRRRFDVICIVFELRQRCRFCFFCCCRLGKSLFLNKKIQR